MSMGASLLSGLGYQPDEETTPPPTESYQARDSYASEPATRSDVAPDIVRYLPSDSVAQADRQTEADDWASTQRQTLADKWAETQSAALSRPTGDVDREIGGTVLTPGANGLDVNGLVPGSGNIGKAPMTDREREIFGDREPRRMGNPVNYLQEWAANLPNDNSKVGDIVGLPNKILTDITNQAVSDLPGGETGLGQAVYGVIIQPPNGKAVRVTEAAARVIEGAAPELQAGLAAANRAPEVGPALVERVKTGLADLEAQLVDQRVPLNRLGPETEALTSAIPGWTQAGIQRAKDDLGPAYEAISENADDLAVLNRVVQLDRYIETAAVKGNPDRLGAEVQGVADAQKQLAQLEADAGPEAWTRIQQANDLRAQALTNLREDLVNSGMMKREIADYLAANQPNYNPTMIAHYVENEPVATQSVKNFKQVLKRLTEEGSEADQIPPMQAALAAITSGDSAIRANVLKQSIVAEGAFKAEKVVTLTKGVDIATGDLATVANKQPGNTNGYILFRRDGDLYKAAVPTDVERTVNGWNEAQLNGFDKTMLALNQTLRVGATTVNPAFLATNMMRDYLQAFVREGVLPQEVLRGAVDALFEGPTTRAYLRGGGGMGEAGGMYVRGQKTQSLANIEDAVAKSGGLVVNRPADLRKLVEAADRGDIPEFAKWMAKAGPIRDVGAAIEMGPRLAAYEKALRGGASEAEAIQAGRRVTVDFSRMGAAMKHANAVSPFLNARVQGTLNVGRALRDEPMARVRLAGLMAASGGLYAYNRNFPEYADIPPYLRENNLIVMLPGSTPNPNGVGYSDIHYLALPVGSWGAFTTAGEETLRAIDSKSPGFMEALDHVVNAAAPTPIDSGGALASLLPAPAKVVLEETANKDYFRDRPIVSEASSKLLPELQYGPRTTEAAKALGGATGTSPERIEHVVGGLTGGAGRLALQGASTVMGQPSDRPPIVGGLTQGIDRTYGGAIQQKAFDERDKAIEDLSNQYRPLIRQFETNTGSGSVMAAPATIGKDNLPLEPADQAFYVKARLEALAEIMADGSVDDDLKGESVEVRKHVLSGILTAANKTAMNETMARIPDEEIDRRIDERPVNARVSPEYQAQGADNPVQKTIAALTSRMK